MGRRPLGKVLLIIASSSRVSALSAR
jgi:hypothetical protein